MATKATIYRADGTATPVVVTDEEHEREIDNLPFTDPEVTRTVIHGD